MSSAILLSSLGGLEASFSVLLTLSYGVLAARMGMVSPTTAKDVSALCRNMFLPALLITNIGTQLTWQNVMTYLPIFVWAILYAAVCIVVGQICAKVFKLPSWTILAITFNNTTSLPLLLTKSLTSTSLLQSIAGGDVNAAVQRAQSYFLINSMVSNAATFAIGPKIIRDDDIDEEDGEETEQEQNVDDRPSQNDGQDDSTPSERTSLLPKPITSGLAKTQSAASNQFHRLPSSLQTGLSYAGSLVNPTLIGAILAIVIGITPPLHKAFFAKMDQGGVLNAWLTSSISNIGELFTSLQMFVVGSKLSSSFSASSESKSQSSPNPPKRALLFIFVIRFIVMAAFSIPAIYLISTRTSLLSDDPMLWFSMMLMPVGPPAMLLSTLIEVADIKSEKKKMGVQMKVARMLGWMYVISPIMGLIVVAALEASKAAMDMKNAGVIRA
ncbi:hypothetical protein M422DRAFT_784807 [Sphaerobolus stellatus SS14]|uniref:Auxin efflux carrier component n=1 Tax=Sphaerobolus stellatus (strain SS14) TaxID=990650 RepID=A0A0C9UEZ4_SPHS4|nr:hypothetical protein M422DRAFT_784807 [Sphaerobolus stellatus SS14]